MTTRAEMAASRRQRLVAESTAQRADLALQMQPLVHTLESVHVGLRIVDRVRRHPGWIVGAAVGLFVITPRRLSSAFRTGSLGLRTWRTIGPALQMLLAQR